MSTLYVLGGAGFAALIAVLYYTARRMTRLRDRLAPDARAPAGPAGFFGLGLGFLIALPLWSLLLRDGGTAETAVRVVRDLALIQAVYGALLLLLLPLLRRVIEPRACATLWVVPPLAYYAFWRMVRPPRYVIRLPEYPARALLAVWLGGAALVLALPMLQHLVFSLRMRRRAQPIGEARVRALWEEERAGFFERARPKYRLFWCDAAPCPLALGVFSKRVLLPPRDYTDEELRLIFRHELCHLWQSDSDNKFLLAVLRALCWFDPLMWLGVRRASEDLERAADDVALLGADGETRARYGALLLSTAAGNTGFSTCLSAGARPLAARLRSVLAPKKKLIGGFAVGLAFLLIFLCMGSVQFSTEYGSADALILPAFADTTVNFRANPSEPMPEPDDGTDAEAVLALLRGKEVAAFYQGRDLITNDEGLTFFFERNGDLVGYLSFSDHCVAVLLYGEENKHITFPDPVYYYVEDGFDLSGFTAGPHK